MDPVRVNAIIDKPREEVFDFLADIANHAEFMDPLFKDWRLTRVDSYGSGAGARFRSRARLDRFGWWELNFITVDPPRQIVAVGRGGKYNRTKTYAEWVLEPAAGGGTRVEFMYESEPAMASDKLMELVSGRRGWYRRSAKKAVKRLQRTLEEGRRSGERTTVAGL